jgi:hypothetical protein
MSVEWASARSDQRTARLPGLLLLLLSRAASEAPRGLVLGRRMDDGCGRGGPAVPAAARMGITGKCRCRAPSDRGPHDARAHGMHAHAHYMHAGGGEGGGGAGATGWVPLWQASKSDRLGPSHYCDRPAKAGPMGAGSHPSPTRPPLPLSRAAGHPSAASHRQVNTSRSRTNRTSRPAAHPRRLWLEDTPRALVARSKNRRGFVFDRRWVGKSGSQRWPSRSATSWGSGPVAR